MAGLIPQSFIDDLLHRVNIVEVIDKRVQMKKSGRNYTACCPFHQEKTPSFSVNEDKQFYYCFGCGAGGNAIGFVMDFDHLDFPVAVENLARDCGLEVPHEQSEASTRKQSENSKLYDVLEQANKYYQQQLRKHENRQLAVDYLKSRGLSGEIARDFCVGYAPTGWDNLINAIGSGPEQQKLLLKAGMIVEKENDKQKEGERGVYDRFRHRIMFPIRDSRGRTIAFGGRVLGDDKPKYLNSPETPVFHKGAELYGLYEARKSGDKFNHILIVEGYMDVIALAQMGVRNSVATLGTATSSTHLTRLFKQVSEIVFCFDGDKAGRTAAWRALETALPQMEDGRQVKFLFLPEGADPDTYIRDKGKDRFDEAIKQAMPLEDFFFEKLTQDLDVKSIEGKARLSSLAKPLIKQLPRGVYGQLMLKRLSKTLDMDAEALDQLMASVPTESAPEMPPAPPSAAQTHSSRPAPTKRRTQLDAYRKPAALKAIELLLRNPEIALTLEQDLAPLHSAEDDNRKLLASLIEMVKEDPTLDKEFLIGYCYGQNEFRGRLTQLLGGERITPMEGVEEEFKQIVDSILSDIKKKLDLLRLKSQLQSQLRSRTDEAAHSSAATKEQN